MVLKKTHNQEMHIEIALKALLNEMQACMLKGNNMLKISRTQKYLWKFDVLLLNQNSTQSDKIFKKLKLIN